MRAPTDQDRALLAKTMTVVLPWPPSVNALTKNISHGRAKTRQYNSWIAEASAILACHRPKHHFEGPVSLLIELNPPDKRRRDGFNFVKAIEDLLVRFQIIPDDCLDYITEGGFKLSDGFEGARVTVTEAG